MRKVEIFVGNRHAGQLKELAKNDYEFSYDEAYLADDSTMPISITLPKSKRVFRSTRIFPFFTNLLPEGANRRAMCTSKKVEEQDFFGMLEMIGGLDWIGNVTLMR